MPAAETRGGGHIWDRHSFFLPFALCLFFLLLYFRLLFGLNYLWEDVVEQHYPNLRFTVDCLKQGIFPHWTPNVFSGMPHQADPQTGLFYPPNWILFLVSFFAEPGGITFIWFILLHVLVLGLGTYFLTREFEFERPAAFFCATAFMFTGFVSLHVIHIIFLYVAAWFPWAFLFLRRAYARNDLKSLAAATIFFGMSILGGYPQYSLHLLYFFLFWTSLEAFQRRQKGWKGVLPILLFFGLFAGLSVGLACVQYLPSFEMTAQSVRESMTYEKSCEGSLPFSGLWTLFSPKFFGFVTGDPSVGSPYWGADGGRHLFWETTLFLGIPTLFLVLLGLRNFKHDLQVRFFAFCALLFLILALGANGPLYHLWFQMAPGFDRFRFPARFAFLLSFSLVLLAGKGLNAFLKSDAPLNAVVLKRLYIFGGAAALFPLLFLFGFFDTLSPRLSDPAVLSSAKQAAGMTILSVAAMLGLIYLTQGTRRQAFAPWSLTFLTFIELFAFAHHFGDGVQHPRDIFGIPGLAPLKTELSGEPFRIQGRLFQGPGKGQMILPRNLGNVQNLPLVEGYNQLLLKRYNEYLYEVNEEVGQKLLNVRYKKIPGQPRFQRLPTVPHAYLTPFYQVLPGRDERLAFMNSPIFVPGRDLALEKAPALAMDTTLGSQGAVKLSNHTPNRWEWEVTAQGNTLMSVSEVYYPAWKAFVDDQETEVLAANHLFRAVALPAGGHRVVMEYRSDAFRRGAWISSFALAGCIFLFLFGIRVEKNRNKTIPL